MNETLELKYTLAFVELCYEHALLNARREAGIHLDEASSSRLTALTTILDARSSLRERRAHVRRHLGLRAQIKDDAGKQYGTILNGSVGGLLVEVPRELSRKVQVTIGKAGSLLYVFFCAVAREEHHGDARRRYGLRFYGAPLKIRYAGLTALPTKERSVGELACYLRQADWKKPPSTSTRRAMEK